MKTLLFLAIWLPVTLLAQQVDDVPAAFNQLNTEPKAIIIENELDVPTFGGHLQGVQVVGNELYISGSSSTIAYVLVADLTGQRTTKLIELMEKPYKHAGGIQLSAPYMAVGIEDNDAKTRSKVCLYNYEEANLYKANPNMIIVREGEVKRYTAGAVGLLKTDEERYLMVVGNWDSRHWDFYELDTEAAKHRNAYSFAAPGDWGSYQSINLLQDDKAIYAIATYKENRTHKADLILVSNTGEFKPIMRKLQTKIFNTTSGADFGSAAGLQVDANGQLHLWTTSRDADGEIVVNRFYGN